MHWASWCANMPGVLKACGRLPDATSEGAGAGVCEISMPKSWCISCLLMTCFSPLFAVQ